jgi:hypothetical protein
MLILRGPNLVILEDFTPNFLAARSLFHTPLLIAAKQSKKPAPAGVQGKGPTAFAIGPLEIMPAATYSPTQFPMQYHRRYQA